jgi:hypothetical protein
MRVLANCTAISPAMDAASKFIEKHILGPCSIGFAAGLCPALRLGLCDSIPPNAHCDIAIRKFNAALEKK